MDIYRFFHPHYNPRLNHTALRQQELSELEQAAAELLKALQRAQQRTKRRPVARILPEHFNDILRALRFTKDSLQLLCDVHPGDTPAELLELMRERSEFTGWETWTALVKEQLESVPVEQPACLASGRGVAS